MPRMGLEATIPLFGLPKTIYAVDCTVLVNDVILRVATRYCVDHYFLTFPSYAGTIVGKT